MAGRKVRCKHCGTTFALPAGSAPHDSMTPIDSLEEIPAASGTPVVMLEPSGPAPAARSPFEDDPFNQPPPDPEQAFEQGFEEYATARGNTPFVFPGSRQLDQWLPLGIVIICVAWLAYQTLFASSEEAQWVGAVRLLVILLTYAGIVFPVCLKGARMAALKLRYELPTGAGFRAFATFLLPVTLGCVLWLANASVPLFILGTMLGLVVALPCMWLLFRIRPDDAPVSLGYGAGAFGIGVLGSVIVLVILNLIVVGVVRAGKTPHTLKISPFGPGFAWDAPPEVKKTKSTYAAGKPARGEPVAATTGKTFGEDAAGSAVTPPPPATQSTVLTTRPAEVLPPPPVAPTDPEQLKVVEAKQAKAVPTEDIDSTTQPTTAAAPQQFEHGPIVAELRPRLRGEMEAIVFPLMPGSAICVVKKSGRQNEDAVELWDTREWQATKSVVFARVQQVEDFQIDSAGRFLARLADFPAFSTQVYSYDSERLLSPSIKIDPKAWPPRLAGFIAKDQLLIMFPTSTPPALEIWDVNKVKRVRRIEIPGMKPEPGNFTIHPNGKWLALLVREDLNGLPTGRLEVYDLTKGTLVRRIPIDELQWNGAVKPCGIGFTEDASRIATLFEHQGQGLFLCWGQGSDIPIYHHEYPGGLVPEGINVASFVEPSFALMDQGNAWILAGASVFDSRTGRLLGDLGLKNITSQRVTSPDTVFLTLQNGNETTLLEARLDITRMRREVGTKR